MDNIGTLYDMDRYMCCNSMKVTKSIILQGVPCQSFKEKHWNTIQVMFYINLYHKNNLLIAKFTSRTFYNYLYIFIKSTELYEHGKFKLVKDDPVTVHGACLEPLNKEEAILIRGYQIYKVS